MRTMESSQIDPTEEHFPPAVVLLVDDHRANLLALEVVLEPLGHQLVLADSGREALRLAAEREFAVIITDVRMPDLDGFELVARLRQITRTPVVMMSAVYGDRATAFRAYSLGAVDFIPKPFDPDLVRWRIGALVSLYRRGQELKLRAALIARKEREAAAAIAAASTAAVLAEEAERKLRQKDKLVGILGHDLRNPLGTVMLALHGLSRGSSGGSKSEEFAKRGIQAAQRMQAMIQDILDFARAAGGETFPIRWHRADLREIAAMVVDEIQMANPQRSIALSAPEQLQLDCDPDRIAQVLGNLLVNAVQHAEGAIAVTLATAAERVLVRVHNDGTPIPDDALPTLFEPFKRSTSKTSGLGLGLHIVREIIRAHRGTVTVHSSLAEGTTFEATWPLNRPDRDASGTTNADADTFTRA
jgi:signal transduction histidine kinase